MKIIKTTLALVGAAMSFTVAAHTTVEWATLGNDTPADSPATYTQRFTVSGDRPMARLAFNQFSRRMETLNPADTLIEIVPGYYAVASPRLASLAPGDTVCIDILTRGTLRNICYAPDGVHGVDDRGNTFPVDFSRMDITASPLFYATASSDLMPYGEAIYKLNAERNTNSGMGPYDVVPSFKNVTIVPGGKSSLPAEVKIVKVDNDRPEYMKATVSNGVVTVETNDSLRAMLRLQPLLAGAELPDAVIEDWPDFGYRGVMIDIARNYQTPAELRRVIDMMARYNLNVLHFHFADDEAWRLEIPGLPELTDLGGRRGYSLDSADFLPQIFTGDGNPDNPEGTYNGHFTRADFVDMLAYAGSKGVKVIPEVESPGHARAAIYSMEKRFRDTGDPTFRLIDPADTSKYSSAQAFHDDVMNPAIPGPVNFMTHVARELKKMYADAGVPMPALHIGGDEVARGAWTGSPLAQEVIAREGMANERMLHLKFVREVVDSLLTMGIPVSGWQEIAVGHDDAYNDAVRPHVYSVNCWSTLGKQKSVTRQSAEAGYPTVLSNVNHFYLDMCYNYHPLERGLTWGGTTDEFDALHGYASVLCPVEGDAKANIAGVSGHLFAETIRSASGLENHLLPKILGLAERGWNADSTYTDPQFNALIARREIPWWQHKGYNFHLAQPGIRVTEAGMVEMNSPYDAGVAVDIRYTIDGTEPDAGSPLYTAPFPVPKGGLIRAKAFLGPEKSSLSTHLNL